MTDIRSDTGGNGNSFEAELKVERDAIDEIDLAIVRLLCERANRSVNVGEIKKKHGLEIHVGSREEEVLAKVTKASEGSKIPAGYIRHLFGEVMMTSRVAQRQVFNGDTWPEGPTTSD